MSDPYSDPEWLEFVQHVRHGTIAKIAGSDACISIVPDSDELDIKFAVELGLMIMMDKPIIVFAHPERPIPDHLRRVADEIVVADIDLEEGQRLLKEALVRLR